MKITVKDQVEYDKWKENNQDSYGGCIFRYAEKWALMMEQEMKDGKEVKDIAKETSNKADTEGITGYMYGAAVNILVQCWIHGDELKKWHNGEYNYSGNGVVNPAIVTLTTEEDK